MGNSEYTMNLQIKKRLYTYFYCYIKCYINPYVQVSFLYIALWIMYQISKAMLLLMQIYYQCLTGLILSFFLHFIVIFWVR